MAYFRKLFVSAKILFILACFVISCNKSHPSYLTISVVPFMSQMNQTKLSSDGNKLAGMFANGDIHIWDAVTGDEVAKLSGLEKDCDHCLVDIAWSADGSKLAVTDDNNQAIVWDVSAQKSLWVLKHGGYDTGWIDAPMFSADGRFLTTRWSNEVIYVWDLASGTQIHRHYAAAPPVFSTDGNMLLLIGDVADARPWNDKGQENPHNVAYLWNFVADSEKALTTKSGIHKAVYTADESQVLLIEAGNPIKLEAWDVATQAMVRSVDLVPPPENGIALTYEFSNDRKQLLLNWSASNQDARIDKIASIWDVAAGKEITQIHQPSLYSKAFFLTSDGSLVGTYTVDIEKPFWNKLQLWNAKSGVLSLDLLWFERNDEMHAPGLNALLIPFQTWSLQGTRFAAAIYDGNVRVWDLEGVSP